jgi:hypothetical protein
MLQNPRRWKSALALIAALLLCAFSIAGYLTVGMLQPAGHQTAAWIYMSLFALSVIAAVWIVLVRRRGSNPSRPAI